MMKPINRMVFIAKDKTKEFVDEWNKNVVDDEFLKDCKKTEELFEHKTNDFFDSNKETDKEM